MTQQSETRLYSPTFLSLAVELAQYIYDPLAPMQGEARSRSCGSALNLSAQSEFQELGLRVMACAVGQAACAIFARHCATIDPAMIENMPITLEVWLAGNGSMPDWPDIALLEPARAYPGRHSAILLPWKAAINALERA